MRFVVQVADKADIKIFSENDRVQERHESMGKGLVVLIGIGQGDTEETARKMVNKLLKLRIFQDENGKTNLNINQAKGNLLLVSQFTLYADIKHGNRPGFTRAEKPEAAEKLYDFIVSECRKAFPDLITGKFGAYMQVGLVNDGPFTVIMDSDEIM